MQSVMRNGVRKFPDRFTIYPVSAGAIMPAASQKTMHFVRGKRDKPAYPRFARLDGQPEGRASTACLFRISGECAEGGKLFERSIDAFAIDVAIEETADLIS